MKKAVLLPIKDFSKGKTRLARMLEPFERQRLARAMYQDVLAGLAGVRSADALFVVTGYEPAAEFAEASGFEILREQVAISESASVDWASGELAASGFDLVLRIPADIPLLQPVDVEELLLAADRTGPFVVLTPSREGTGTNAIIRNPPALFPSHFGPNSLALHKDEAAHAGAECIIAPNSRIALDIDEPGDLAEFLKMGEGTLAFREAVEMGLVERLVGIEENGWPKKTQYK